MMGQLQAVPCGDCVDGHCTMNCGPAAKKERSQRAIEALREPVGWDHGQTEHGGAWSGCYGVICLDDPTSQWRGDELIMQLRAAGAEHDVRQLVGQVPS